MEEAFSKSEWIWSRDTFVENEYAEFYDVFNNQGKKTVVNISVRGDYVLFVNGKYTESNQYGDFEHYKIYDTVDITDMLVEGENRICILVWYFGRSGMRYFTEKPGLIYEVVSGGKLVLASDEETMSRKSNAYESGAHIHKISPQLGYSFKYDATKEDEWIYCGNNGFSKSFVMGEKGKFYKRPNKKLQLNPICRGEVTRYSKGYLVDLGEEFVGLCSFSINSESEQSINISYGECLSDGRVKRIINDRDFSFEYVANSGKNTYTNYMLRLACRYIEIECENPIDIEYIGIIPQVYPCKENKVPNLSELDKRIYEICVNTLKLCMMEHYVDCPWREQCLYAFDARNQMLSGYYAFADKNIEYARSNLLLMSKDRREDKLLSICYPSGEDLVIPAFSLYYVVAVNEYMEYSGDLTLGKEVFDKLTDVLRAFMNNREDGMLKKFSGKSHWNFYDWATHLEGKLFEEDNNNVDFMLNAIAVYALGHYGEICRKLGRENIYVGVSDIIAGKVRDKFFNPETEAFFVENMEEEPTELANSFAILSGIAKGELAKRLAKRIAGGEFSPCSFSMKCFKYDALLSIDKEYKNVILEEIRTAYKKMLDEGYTTVWETDEGPGSFDKAGSLCHGWSAIPIYFFNLLLVYKG